MRMNDSKKLQRLGFEKSAKFWWDKDGLELEMRKHSREKNGVYALVINNKLMYIGKTHSEFYRRIYGYKNPGPSQKTNRRINEKMREKLKSQGVSKICQCWYLPKEKIYNSEIHLDIGKEKLDINSGPETVERLLISYFQPLWNKE